MTPPGWNRTCVIVSARNHGFVNGIILLPDSGQALAALESEIAACCLRARFGLDRRISQPPSPPEFGSDRARLHEVNRN